MVQNKAPPLWILKLHSSYIISLLFPRRAILWAVQGCTPTEPYLGVLRNIIPWMNGFNTLLMAGWFVGFYVSVLGEFKHNTVSKRPLACFSSPVALAQIQLCYSSLIWVNMHKCTSSHTGTLMQVLRCQASFILHALWSICILSSCGKVT